MPEPQVKIRVTTKQEGSGPPLGGLAGALKSIPGLGGIASSAMAKLAGAVGSVGAAFATAAKAVHDFAAQQEKIAGLDAALGRSGQLTDEYREKLHALAGELQNATSIADDQWITVLTKLVQFGSRPESIGMDVTAVKNLAGIVGDLGTATSLYSRALQGNFTAFSRYGIIIGEVGDKTQRLAQLQEMLASRGGGQLEARAESLNGRFTNLKNVIGDASEAIGQQISSGLRLGEILDFLAGGFEWWAEKIGGTTEKLDGIHNSTVDATESASDYATQLALVAQLSERVAAATEDETKWIKAKQQAQDEISDAQMALDLAKVDDAEKSGRLSKRGAIMARSQIRSSAAAAKFDRAQQADLQALEVNESGLADMLKVRNQLASRRSALAEQIKTGGVAESRARAAGDTISTLQSERSFVESQGGDVGIKQQRLAEIDRAIAIAQRIGPANLDAKRNELGAIDTSLGSLDASIATRRGAVLSANTEIGQRLSTRAQVFDLNQQRDAIGSIGEAGAGTSAALQQSLSAVIGSSQASVNVAAQFLRISQDTERRLQQLEAQARGQLNR